MTDPQIIVSGVHVSRLHQVGGDMTLDFRIRAGTLNIIGGPNGAGKTTLLDILAMRRPLGRSGRIERIGHSTWADIAYLPQHLRAVEDVTVRGLTGLAGRRGSALARAKRFLRDTGVPMSARLGTLSGGQVQYLCFALVAAQRAAVYVYDEPFRHLDGSRVDDLLNELADQVLAGSLVIATDNEGRLAASKIHNTVVTELAEPEQARLGRLGEVSRA